MLIALAIVLQIFIFAGMTFVLKKILSENVVSATKHIDEINQDYIRKDQEVTARLEEAKRKAEEIISQAVNESNQIKQKAIKEMEDKNQKALQIARGQSEEIMRQAENSRQALISELEDRIKEQSVKKACELIQHTLPDEFKRIVHTRWLDELIEKGFSNLEHTRLPRDAGQVRIVSAFTLDQPQRDSLNKKIKAVCGDDADIKEEIRPDLVAGIVIHIGSLVLDGSLKNKIQEKAKERL